MLLMSEDLIAELNRSQRMKDTHVSDGEEDGTFATDLDTSISGNSHHSTAAKSPDAMGSSSHRFSSRRGEGFKRMGSVTQLGTSSRRGDGFKRMGSVTSVTQLGTSRHANEPTFDVEEDNKMGTSFHDQMDASTHSLPMGSTSFRSYSARRGPVSPAQTRGLRSLVSPAQTRGLRRSSRGSAVRAPILSSIDDNDDDVSDSSFFEDEGDDMGISCLCHANATSARRNTFQPLDSSCNWGEARGELDQLDLSRRPVRKRRPSFKESMAPQKEEAALEDPMAQFMSNLESIAPIFAHNVEYIARKMMED